MNTQLTEFWQKQKKQLVMAAVLLGFLFFFFIRSDEEATVKNEKDVWSESVESVQPEEAKQKQEKEETIVLKVDIKGAVKSPGVYEFAQGDRVTDVIGMAGGLTDTADSKQVNMAQLVKDEMVIYIPKAGEEIQDGQTSSAGMGGGGANDGLVNINKATLEELQNLPGIGPSKAAAIIAKREELGSFGAIEDLKLVTGIGDKTFEKLKDFITS